MVVFNRAKERAALIITLRSRGYHHEMLKEAPGRYIDMYWHRDILNYSGDFDKPAGTIMRHQSTLKDTQDRLNVRGLTQAQVAQGYLTLLPWPPSASCTCRTCQDTYQPLEVTPSLEPVQSKHNVASDGLCACGWKSEAPKKASRKSAVYRHVKLETSDVTMAESVA